MHAAGDQPGKMRHVDQKLRPNLIGDGPERPEIDDARIGGPPGDNDLGPMFACKLRHLVNIDPVVVPAHAVGHRLEPAPAF